MTSRFVRSLFVVLLTLICTHAFAGHRFNASATAISGSGRAAIASVALPPSGGVAESVVRDYDDGFVRFTVGRSLVRGVKEGAVAVTTTEVTIVDLWFGDRIHADRVVMRTNARQAVHDAEPSIDFEGSAIENLTVDGVAIDTSLDTAFFAAHPTFASLTAAESHIQCSAYGRASCGVAPRRVPVRGLGTLAIGDVFVKNGARYIEMLRLDRRPREGRLRVDGDDDEGSVGAGDGGTNGAPTWP